MGSWKRNTEQNIMLLHKSIVSPYQKEKQRRVKRMNKNNFNITRDQLDSSVRTRNNSGHMKLWIA